MKRTIVRLIAVVVGLAGAFSALASVLALYGVTKYSETRQAGNLDAAVFLAIVALFLLWITVGLFKSRKWALVATIILVGLCFVYSLTKIAMSKRDARLVGTMTVLVSSVVVDFLLIYAASMSNDLPSLQGFRPAGVTAMAIVDFVAVALSVLTIPREIRDHAASWQLASTLFNMLLCAALSLGLWKVKEWARLLTEITGFLAPLGVLPLFLGVNRHRPILVTIASALLIYAGWTVWYLRRPQIERAFARSESITL
jgi:hypothetical protein